MQASRSKGAMSRSSDRRQSAKELFTSPSLTALVPAVAFGVVGLPRCPINSATLTLFAFQSAHDARMYHSALVSYCLRARGTKSPVLHSDTERRFILRLSPDLWGMGVQANQFGSYLSLRRPLEYAEHCLSVYPPDFSLHFSFFAFRFAHIS